MFEVLTFINGFIEAKLMVTPTDDDNNRVNIEQSGRWNGRVLQLEIQLSDICSVTKLCHIVVWILSDMLHF